MFEFNELSIYNSSDKEDKQFIDSLLSSYNFPKELKKYIEYVVKVSDKFTLCAKPKYQTGSTHSGDYVCIQMYSAELKEKDFDCLKKNKYFINFSNTKPYDWQQQEIFDIYMKPLEV